ncbi:glucose-1-phosphate adenylyltransferase subunit GlgD [Pectinatus sottacetonis]|uniref:glucose-1-phosphate adenylyltransferase subunit GlgD n=1 Tax=Pectinatus sottacetonis TaxID=1002795 RepID=UPI0018C852A2|nr:glucose-1-phosphate adenylyltransferase subunit GlgD [Pectinatus sottacetonis]
MNHVLGLINLQEDNSLIREITRERPIATIPFAGRYRLIDFILSNMVNSGIINVGILLPNKSNSVLNHIRSGKDWDLARRHEGLFYLPPRYDKNNNSQSELRTLYQNIDFIEHSGQDYVLLSSSHTVFNMDFNNVLRFHQNTGAAITMIYYTNSNETAAPCTVIQTKDNGLLTDIASRHVAYKGSNISMGVCLMSLKTFVDIIRYSYERGGTDFLADGIMRVQDKYNIYGYQYTGYVSTVNSIIDYYKASMQLLDPKIWQKLFLENSPIYTMVKDDVPAQYKTQAKVHNSLISNGCSIEGSVDNSILFRNVKIERGATIKNSIIMPGCEIKENSLIENVICDKNVIINSQKWLKGAKNYPFVIEKNTVI